jgi:2',3'-cyclic-nucleotide 2'-phosphodiesterase (5'-nucleotidase family)
VARRATIIKQIRAEAGNVLLLDAGNSLVGDRDPAVRTQGQTSIEAMNMMGYDAMALGEMDLRLGTEVLGQRQTEASFPLLSANTVLSASGALPFRTYTVKEMAGHRVGIIGLSDGADLGEIQVQSPLETARQLVAQLGKEADIIILLSHAGLSTDKEIAARVPDIDVIVSGGPETLNELYRDPAHGTAIVHADVASPGHAGRLIGVGTLTFDRNGRLQDAQWSKVSLGPEVAEDPAMAAWEAAHR